MDKFGPQSLVLGIETSCDETAAAVVRGGRNVLSSVVASQHDLHAEYAGVVPELASRAHVEALLPVVREALARAGVGLGMIDAIAVGNRPGLIGSLLVGVAGAKALAFALGKPLVGVDHVRAHLYSGALREESDGLGVEDRLVPEAGGNTQSPSPQSPTTALGLVVSGGHTAMYTVRSWTDIERLGGTIDDAMGEAYDKVAAMLGLPHPGGPNVDRIAQEPGANDRAHDFPISRLGPGSLDFSFSGLKTAVLYAIKGVPGERGSFPREASALSHDAKRDIAASFQRAACAAIMLKLDRAIHAAQERGVAYCTLHAGGGVLANSRLRRELQRFAHTHTMELRVPPPHLCMDNAAMIAGLGHELLRAGQRDTMMLQATPT